MDGVWLMVVGMTTVFAFLSVLVGVMQLSAKIVSGLPEPVAEQTAPAQPKVDELAEIAVILAAVEAHRRG